MHFDLHICSWWEISMQVRNYSEGGLVNQVGHQPCGLNRAKQWRPISTREGLIAISPGQFSWNAAILHSLLVFMLATCFCQPVLCQHGYRFGYCPVAPFSVAWTTFLLISSIDFINFNLTIYGFPILSLLSPFPNCLADFTNSRGLMNSFA